MREVDRMYDWLQRKFHAFSLAISVQDFETAAELRDEIKEYIEERI